ncbi:MAG: hypothetical protein QXT25_04410 [Candidatus Anstonellaceae archaeon]
MGRWLLLVLGLSIALSSANAGLFDNTIGTALQTFCEGIMNLLPIISMLMIVFAGVVYAGGQMMGAETRARANVWATAALVGAVIGILIVVVTPKVLQLMLSNTGVTWSGNGCPGVSP